MIRFGIVGFGLHAVRRLMPGFDLARNCKVVALSRRDPAKAQESARHYGIAHAFTSTEELCRCPDVDAVLVTSPDVLHRADTLTALCAGKPVLCEKPMAMNTGECREMVEAARAANVLLGVAQVFRFEASTARLREQIASGAIGTPVTARVEFSYLGSGHHRTWLYDRKVAAGGPVADVGVHCIDALRYILQDDPVRITAIARKDEQSGDVEGAAILTLEFSKGTLATVLVSTRANYRTPVEFVGRQGVLRADDGLTVDRPVVIELWREQKVVAAETVTNQLAYARQVDSFADAIEGKGTFPVAGVEGWKNQMILDAAYRSIASGKSEEMTLGTG
ncbi:MAG: Gfo/Idh/MocA family oxidoreductase [Acidobacteria bacterium]|nr:Gfo/Idh/MocA family oxidoreductase [Acidobacteriota bacterium]